MKIAKKNFFRSLRYWYRELQTTQEHIHFHLLEIAKYRLLGSDESVKEIAQSLGFEYSHYFSSLFKKKLGISPSAFRTLNYNNFG